MGACSTLRTPTSTYHELYLPLHGRYQGDNAVAALTAAEAFFDAPLAQDVVEEAFAAVRMPGRFEVLGHQPLVIVDGAHNPPAADTCASVLFDDFDPVGKKILRRRLPRRTRPPAMLEALRADEMDAVICCTPSTSRGIPAAEVASGGPRDRLRRRVATPTTSATPATPRWPAPAPTTWCWSPARSTSVGHARPHLLAADPVGSLARRYA